MQIRRAAGCKVPRDWLYHMDEEQNTPPEKDAHLPDFHIPNDTIADLAEGIAVRTIGLFRGIPPLKADVRDL